MQLGYAMEWCSASYYDYYTYKELLSDSEVKSFYKALFTPICYSLRMVTLLLPGG